MKFGKRKIDFSISINRLAATGKIVKLVNVNPSIMKEIEPFKEYNGVKVMFISEGWIEINERFFLELKTSEGLVYTMSPIFIT